MVIIEHSAQPLTTQDHSAAASARLFPHDQPVVQPLVVSLAMIMHHEFVHGLPQRAFSEQNYSLQARFLDGSDKALGMGIQIRRARRQFDRLHSRALQDLQEFRSEQGIPIMDQVAFADQEAFRRVAEIACHLTHPEPVGLPGESANLHAPTCQVDEEEHQEPGQAPFESGPQ